ncbi:alcohol dehydrogenase [Chania multitudinisentens RB-25]|uniref:Alcohol dehydrogenase n=1 Tax=Chania multitudinisentens RB-25 TaxID=1441930 RepID=W0LA57_9GAMM|nr:zinc-dependent alcohol dehydrogenase family protein [Chania multitudinisentens]AHG20606.1 alcohol dehydrogenase [Chania multitudinisentens RB-25]
MHNLALWYRKFGAPEETLKIERKALDIRPINLVRIRMICSPVNASDLIPITGAYGHRIVPPLVAGYEGVGYVFDAPDSYKELIGKRVLPLMGQGTWQKFVDCEPDRLISVPDDISDELASRAYINPVAALMLLRTYSPQGKRILLTASSSDCGILLGQWALLLGAKSVTGIYRSSIHERRLYECGITPISQDKIEQISLAANESDLVFDAVGGELAELLLENISEKSVYVCYGSLSGKLFRQKKFFPEVKWFHLRDYVKNLSVMQWKNIFIDIWSLLKISKYHDTISFSLNNWQDAIKFYKKSGREQKPILIMK